jgi:hypothetical protein
MALNEDEKKIAKTKSKEKVPKNEPNTIGGICIYSSLSPSCKRKIHGRLNIIPPKKKELKPLRAFSFHFRFINHNISF